MHTTNDLATFSNAPRPIGDPARLAAVARDGIRNGRPREDLTWVCGITQRALRTDVALLTLLDADSQHYLSQRGLDGDSTGAPLSHSLCRFVVERDAPLVVHDAARHQLLRNHPAVIELGVVSYAGVPWRSPDGLILGALCVLHHTPRVWSVQELEDLERLAVIVRNEIDLRARVGDEVPVGGPPRPER